MRLFNISGNGGEEIVSAVGLISSGITFDKWEPIIPLGIREVVAIIGPEPVAALAEYYENENRGTPEMDLALAYLQKAVAFFTWLKIIPTLDAQHDETGRSRRLGENEKGLTALQEYKDEENITRLAYEATDALVEVMDSARFDFWTSSKKYRQREGLLIQSREEFDEYYAIGSSRLYVTLLPIIREVQQAQVEPILGREYMQQVLAREDSIAAQRLGYPAAHAVVLLTIQKAIERLPVTVLPEGIVQVQISQPVKSYLRAEQAARDRVTASLQNDVNRYLKQLQDIVAELDAENAPSDSFIPRPIVHSRGMTF